MYYDLHNSEKRNSELRSKHAQLEGGTASPHETVQTFSRSELMQKRIDAKRGNPEAESWLRQNREAVAIAYEEGRIVD